MIMPITLENTHLSGPSFPHIFGNRLQQEVKQRIIKRTYDQIGAFDEHARHLKDGKKNQAFLRRYVSLSTYNWDFFVIS